MEQCLLPLPQQTASRIVLGPILEPSRQRPSSSKSKNKRRQYFALSSTSKQAPRAGNAGKTSIPLCDLTTTILTQAPPQGCAGRPTQHENGPCLHLGRRRGVTLPVAAVRDR